MEALNALVGRRMGWLSSKDFDERLAKKDGSLFSDDSAVAQAAGEFMGWVDVASRTLEMADEIEAFAKELQTDGTERFVVLGMGGSSLSSLMLAQAAPRLGVSGVRLEVLDSTVPGDVERVLNTGNLDRTVFMVASKSGTTIEPLAMEEFFWKKLTEKFGDEAWRSMIAVTDPGSEMEKRARERGYAKVFLGEPEVGGRFSVFSVFGMVPAAVAGYDIRAMLGAVVSRGFEAGKELGSWMGELALGGWDKVTMVTDPGSAIGLWVEQLVAESTGKGGVGVLPLALEPTGKDEVYGEDRAFYVVGAEKEVEVLLGLLHLFSERPVMTRTVESQTDLAEMLYDWEVGTAVAGLILDVNPFDQPNVQAAKDVAKKKLGEIQESGSVDLGSPDAELDGVGIYGISGSDLGVGLVEFLDGAESGDFVAFLAFVPEDEATFRDLQEIREGVRDRLKVATSLGFGPRYLHSTGQYHKGGPNKGLFVVLTADDGADLDIPGMGATFGQLKTAQALGDIGALQGAGRRVVHLHLGDEVRAGLAVISHCLGID